jgi:hypothetical protein
MHSVPASFACPLPEPLAFKHPTIFTLLSFPAYRHCHTAKHQPHTEIALFSTSMDPPLSLSKDELQEVEKTISYRFENLTLLREALRDPGYCNDDGNGVFALLGDKSLGLMIGLQGHKSGDDLGEKNPRSTEKASKLELIFQCTRGNRLRHITQN